MHKLTATVLVATLLTLLSGVPAHPAGNPGCDSRSEGASLTGAKEVQCAATETQTTPGTYVAPRPGSLARRSLKPMPDVVRVPELGNVPPGGLCRQRGSTTIPSAVLARPEYVQWRVWIQIVNGFPPCGVAKVDPEETVVAVLEEVPLPAPAPSIAPGWAITGKSAFLEPNLAVPVVAGMPTVVDIRSTELGDMALTATAVYNVDWGDARTGPHAGPGGPWPDGTIVHTWTDAGTYDVVVTAVWTVDWRLGAASGRLTVPTEGTIADFRVDQLQAVRNR